MKEEAEYVNKEIDEVLGVQTKEVPLTVDFSLREILYQNRDWMLGGWSRSWQYKKSADGLKVIMIRW